MNHCTAIRLRAGAWTVLGKSARSDSGGHGFKSRPAARRPVAQSVTRRSATTRPQRHHDRGGTRVLPAAVRAAPRSIATRSTQARVDEYIRLNRPGLYGDAYVRVFVEDTTARRRRHNRDLRLTLRIADCANTINLEFSLDSPELRENSLFKIDTLLGALHRFRDGLAAEAELAEQRDDSRLTRRCDDDVSEASRHATRAAVGAAPGPGARTPPAATPGRSTSGRACAAS